MTPNLQVPKSRPRPSRGSMGGLIFVMLLLVLVIQILSVFISPKQGDAFSNWRGQSGLTYEQLREAALELEDKNVHSEAAELWKRYLSMASLEPAAEADIRYRIGKNLENGGQFENAFAQFVLAEKLVGDANPDLADKIGQRRRECLRRMGRFADLAREIAEQAAANKDATALEGQQVVAEVGHEKITLAEFDRLLSNEIEMAVKSRMGISSAEEDALRKRAFEQFADPEMRAQQLHQIIATRLLADEARKRDLHQTEAYRNRLVAVADVILSQTLLHEEIVKRATVTDADVERFHKANLARYEEPAASFIAHIQCRDETHARDVVSRIQQGASFEKIAKAESLDAGTREKFGILTAPVLAEGTAVPMFGERPDLHGVIRGAEAGKILDEPWESDRGWHVIKVVSHRERLERPFEEIAEVVRRDTVAAREREVTDQYLAELFKVHQVALYPNAFQAAETGEKEKADVLP